MFKNVDSNVLVSTFFGVNNLVDAAESFQKKEYAESVTNLAKVALKWTCMGAVCMGFSRLMAESPIYLNDVHGRAVNGLNEDGSQEISSDGKLLLDKYFQEQSHFKRWPQSGKDYIAQCLEGNTDEASYSTRYFIEKSIDLNDSSALKEVIKSCSKAVTTTKSCLSAQEVLIKNSEKVVGGERKLLSACRKSENAFCLKVREDAVNSALKENDWDSLLKNCIKLKVNSEPCTNGLGLLEHKLAVPSKEAWSLAKKIDAKCRNSDLPVCLKSREFVFENIMQYGSWEQIIKFVGSNCRKEGAQCANLVEEASSAFIEEIIKVEGLKADARDVYLELVNRVSIDHAPSKVSMALTLAEACVVNPTYISKRNAEKLLSRLKRYKNSLGGYLGWSNYYDEQLLPLLDTKIKALNKKIENLPAQDGPTNFYSERSSSRSVETPRRNIVYKFDCNRMDWVERNLVRMAGRQGSLQLGHLFDRRGNQVKEEEVDWESCGL